MNPVDLHWSISMNTVIKILAKGANRASLRSCNSSGALYSRPCAGSVVQIF